MPFYFHMLRNLIEIHQNESKNYRGHDRRLINLYRNTINAEMGVQKRL